MTSTETLTLERAARYLGAGTAQVRWWVTHSALPCVKGEGGGTLVRRADVAALLLSQGAAVPRELIAVREGA